MIDDLRRVGPKVTAGQFLLDEARAREKLAQFRLVDPRHYVLEFVKAAYLLGARQVMFSKDADELEMCFDGEAINAEEMDDLFAPVFSTRETLHQEAMRHLAIGINAARGIGLSHLKVRRKVVSPWLGLDEATEVSSIYLKERAHPRHLAKFFLSVMGTLPEEAILHERCAMSTLPIFFNGVRLSAGHRVDDGARHLVDIDTSDERGILGVMPETDRRTLYVLHRGVAMRKIVDVDPIIGWSATVDSSRLTMNLSQSDVVEDRIWAELNDEVLFEALLRSLMEYLEALYVTGITTKRSALRMYVARALTEVAKRPLQSASARETFKTFIAVVELLPLYRLANPAFDTAQQFATWCSIAELRRHSPYTGQTFLHIASVGDILHYEGPMLCFDPVYGESIETFRPFAVYVHEGERATLALREEGERAALAQREEAQRKEAQRKLGWVGSSWPSGPTGEHACAAWRRSLPGGFDIALGFDGPERRGHMFIVEGETLVDFRSLDSENLGPDLLGEISIYLVDRKGGAEAAYVEAALEILDALPELIEEHVHLLNSDAYMSYVQSLFSAELARKLWKVLALPALDLEPWLAATRGAWALGHSELGHSELGHSELGHSEDELCSGWDAVLWRIERLGQGAEASCFEVLDGPMWPLRRIAAWYERQSEPYLIFVPRHKLIRGRNHAHKIRDKGLFIVGDTAVYDVLHRTFGEYLRRVEDVASPPRLISGKGRRGPGEDALRRGSHRPFITALKALQKQVGLDTHDWPHYVKNEGSGPVCRLQGEHVVINREHPVSRYAIDHQHDKVALAFVVSPLIRAHSAKHHVPEAVERGLHANLGRCVGEYDPVEDK